MAQSKRESGRVASVAVQPLDWEGEGLSQGADPLFASSKGVGFKMRMSTKRRSGVVSTMVDVGSSDASGSQRMYSRIEMSMVVSILRLWLLTPGPGTMD